MRKMKLINPCAKSRGVSWTAGKMSRSATTSSFSSSEYLRTPLTEVSMVRKSAVGEESRNFRQDIDETPTHGVEQRGPARRQLRMCIPSEAGRIRDDGNKTNKDEGADEQPSEREDDEDANQGDDYPDFGVLEDFTTYLEKLIVEHRQKKGERGEFDLKEKEVKRFLMKADVKFVGFPNGDRLKSSAKPKRLMSSKTSVFRNRTGKEASYILRASVEDSVMAQVSTKSGFSVGVAAGLTLGGPPGGAGILAGGSFSKEKEKQQGSSSVTKREMEAKATVGKDKKLVATESIYHIDYEADCKFDFSVEDKYKFEYKVPKKIFNEEVKAKDIGFKYCEEDFETATEDKKVHITATFHTTLVSVQHEIDFVVK